MPCGFFSVRWKNKHILYPWCKCKIYELLFYFFSWFFFWRFFETSWFFCAIFIPFDPNICLKTWAQNLRPFTFFAKPKQKLISFSVKVYYLLSWILGEQRKLTRAEPATSRLTCLHSYQLHMLAVSLFLLSISLFGGRQSEFIQPYTAL